MRVPASEIDGNMKPHHSTNSSTSTPSQPSARPAFASGYNVNAPGFQPQYLQQQQQLPPHYHPQQQQQYHPHHHQQQHYQGGGGGPRGHYQHQHQGTIKKKIFFSSVCTEWDANARMGGCGCG